MSVPVGRGGVCWFATVNGSNLPSSSSRMTKIVDSISVICPFYSFQINHGYSPIHEFRLLRHIKLTSSVMPFQSRRLVGTYIQHLVKLYEAWDKPAEAAKWKAPLKKK